MRQRRASLGDLPLQCRKRDWVQGEAASGPLGLGGRVVDLVVDDHAGR
jgi:hypothetical protein